MAERPVFYVHHGLVVNKTYSFEWFPGFSLSQKQKSVESLHDAVRKADAAAKPLEVSTKSRESLGIKLSAFNLKWNGYTLENIFQSAKVFEMGGPYLELLEVSPKEAKRDERLKNSGPLRAFRYQNEDFPLLPKTVFYDYIYLAAVKESLTEDEIKAVSDYNYFTDIEFNPTKSINTQAKTAAMIKLIMDECGVLPDFTKENFIQCHKKHVVS